MANILWLLALGFGSLWDTEYQTPRGTTPPGALAGAGLGQLVNDPRTSSLNELNQPIRNSTFNFQTPAFGGYQPSAIGGMCAIGSCQAKQRVLACWDARVHWADDTLNKTKLPGLKGTVYLLCNKSNETVAAKGSLVIDMFDAQDRKLEAWTFDPVTLAKLKRKDLIGTGYTLFLPLSSGARAQDIKLTVRSNSEAGPCDSTQLSLNVSDAAVIPARNAIERAQTLQGRPVSQTRSRQVTLVEVVKLSKHGIRDDIIIRQIEATGSRFELTVPDIIWLRDQGVSQDVIRAMQGATQTDRYPFFSF